MTHLGRHNERLGQNTDTYCTRAHVLRFHHESCNFSHIIFLSATLDFGSILYLNQSLHKLALLYLSERMTCYSFSHSLRSSIMYSNLLAVP